MPSEDLKETPVYDFKLDIFSFQYLTFYVAAQQLPSVHELNDKAMYAALKKEQFKSRGEEELLVEKDSLSVYKTNWNVDQP